MNFIKVFQLFTFILLEIYETMGEDKMPYDRCKITPTDVDKVDVVSYVNGATSDDLLFYQRYCSWIEDGFPYSQYAPVIIKVGAKITCDSNNVCTCPNSNKDEKDCKVTFQHVCAEQILGQENFHKFICCTSLLIDPGNHFKGFNACADEQPGLQDKITACMAKTGDGSPQDVALKNAQEVMDKGVKITENNEPFFFYNGIFDECVSADSPSYFLQKICAMLKKDVAMGIDQCKKAMGW